MLTPRSIRRFIAVFVLFISLPFAGRAQAAPQYGGRIVAPPDASETVKEAVADLADALQRMTGQAYAALPDYTGDGIFLARTNAPNAPADAVVKLKGKGREPFILRSTNDKNLWIIANGNEGLSHGIYYYLEQLGCHWFLPNDKWTVIPQRADVALKIDRLVSPAFHMRAFSGTGGYGPASVYDPKYDKDGRLQFRIRWENWKRRNRFGGEFVLAGHAGEDFNLRHKEFLQQHPEYLAEVGGKREYSITAKLDASNPDAVKLWVDDRVAQFAKQRKESPDTPYSFAVSVDPADGGGFCDCAQCKAKFAAPTAQQFYSNQVFYMANEVAKAVRRDFPDGFVNLYAYADHSAPPTFALEPNVYVAIIPYGFNYSGLQPNDFIRAWGKKAARISVYDYWSIPDWSQDRPTFNYLETARDKIRFWHDNHVEGFLSESTFGAGAIGITWYLASRLMWDPDANQDAILNAFYKKSFGPAAPPMQRMLERWARGFLLASHELGTAYRDLQEAYRLAGDDAAVVGRIDDFARYVHFLRLQCEKANATTAEARATADRKQVEHLFDIYETNMVHSFRLYQFLVDYGRNTALYEEFDQHKKEAPGWQRVAPLSHDEVMALVEDGAKTYQPLDFTMRTYSGKMVRLNPANLVTTETGEKKWGTAMGTRGGLDAEIETPPGLKSLPLRVSLYYDCTTELADAAGKIVFTHATKGIKEYLKWDEFEVPIPAPGRYTIQFRPIAGGGFRFQMLNGLPLVIRSFISEMGGPSPRLYFYVPRGLQKIALYYPLGDFNNQFPPQIMDPDGKRMPIERHDGGKMMLVAVPPGMDGKVWSLADSRSPDHPHRMLNVPHVFAFSPETLSVPADAINEPRP